MLRWYDYVRTEKWCGWCGKYAAVRNVPVPHQLKKSCGARTEIKFSAAPPIYITLSYKV